MVELGFNKKPFTKEEAITMDCQDNTTFQTERTRGQHLRLDDRGAIQWLHNLGYSNRTIARKLNCSSTTIGNELRRGTPEHSPGRRGRKPGYTARRGQAAYEAHRRHCRKPHRILCCEKFTLFVVKQVREHRWSLDACVGYARLHYLFEADAMVCTKTLYNALRAGQMPLTPFELPEMLKRKPRTPKNHVNKRPKGRSIEERPAVANERSEIGHWEADTVVGRRAGMDSVVLTLLEKSTDHYFALRIPGRTSEAVMEAMRSIRSDYGDKFSQIFKTITTDNGSEFEDLSLIEQWGTNVYFAHPYSSWERPQNERHNGLLRRYIPKGVSIDRYHAEQILAFSDEINGLPRRLLGYRTPEELFDTFLDKVFAA
jgi:IS30 family transposase